MADIAATLDEMRADIRTIVLGEIELAKAEVTPGAKKAGIGAGLLAGAAVFGIIAVNVIFWSLGFAFTNLFWGNVGPVGAFGFGFLCAAGVYIVIALILAAIGIVHVKKLRGPTAAIAEGEKTSEALRQATQAGLDNVSMLTTRGKKVLTLSLIHI